MTPRLFTTDLTPVGPRKGSIFIDHRTNSLLPQLLPRKLSLLGLLASKLSLLSLSSLPVRPLLTLHIGLLPTTLRVHPLAALGLDMFIPAGCLTLRLLLTLGVTPLLHLLLSLYVPLLLLLALGVPPMIHLLLPLNVLLLTLDVLLLTLNVLLWLNVLLPLPSTSAAHLALRLRALLRLLPTAATLPTALLLGRASRMLATATAFSFTLGESRSNKHDRDREHGNYLNKKFIRSHMSNSLSKTTKKSQLLCV